MTTAEVLRKAAERLRTHGWTTRVYLDPAGRCCALGAIQEACGDMDSREYRDARKAMMDVVGGWIDDWNDHPGRTAEEVIAALEAAAKAEEERAP